MERWTKLIIIILVIMGMVMGVFYKRNGEWKFNAIGEPTKDRTFEQTLETVKQRYL